MRSSMGNDQACRVCCSLSPPSSEGAGLVSSSDFLCTSSALPLHFLCTSSVGCVGGVGGVAKSVPYSGSPNARFTYFFDLTGIVPSIHLPAPNFPQLLSDPHLSECRNGFADNSSALQWARQSCDPPWEMIRLAGSAAA